MRVCVNACVCARVFVCMCDCVCAVFFMVYSIKEAKRWGVAPDVTTIGTYVTDLVIIVLIPAGFMAGGNAKTQSNSETARIVGKWADIGWWAFCDCNFDL